MSKLGERLDEILDKLRNDIEVKHNDYHYESCQLAKAELLEAFRQVVPDKKLDAEPIWLEYNAIGWNACREQLLKELEG